MNCSYRHFVIGMEPKLIAYSPLVNKTLAFQFFLPFYKGWIVRMILCMIQLSFLSKMDKIKFYRMYIYKVYHFFFVKVNINYLYLLYLLCMLHKRQITFI
jgi:hypothetical protein